jgi:hypothetical protein
MIPYSRANRQLYHQGFISQPPPFLPADGDIIANMRSPYTVDLLYARLYNTTRLSKLNTFGAGCVIVYGSLFPTGGIAREHLLVHDPVEFRGRRYSPDDRRFVFHKNYLRLIFLGCGVPVSWDVVILGMAQ